MEESETLASLQGWPLTRSLTLNKGVRGDGSSFRKIADIRVFSKVGQGRCLYGERKPNEINWLRSEGW